jgi:hypothetical protein
LTQLLQDREQTSPLDDLDIIGRIPCNFTIDFPLAAMNKLRDARTPTEPDDTAQVHIATQGSKSQDQSPWPLQKGRRFVTDMLEAIHDINASMRSINI